MRSSAGSLDNLYLHFPYCRRKCTYCALPSRAVKPDPGYVARLVKELPPGPFKTIYFGGGTPALCDLRPLLDKLSAPEFTVELHPLDVKRELLETLTAGGVNRISMGVQSFNDDTLRDMGRGYTADEAHRAFDLVRAYFENSGIDLIVGYPGDRWELEDWGFKHCSIYSLILEEKSILYAQKRAIPGDDETLDRIREVAEALSALGLRRYEISSYAVPGFECRHNLAVWKGEDYLGLGDGAESGLDRSPLERILRLRTYLGLDGRDFPAAIPKLDFYVREGLLEKTGTVYRLTPRGTEVCDSILADIV